MTQYSIRNLLLFTLFIALSLSLIAAEGLDGYVIVLASFLHFILLCVLPVAAIEYDGHRRCFAASALVFEVAFLYSTSGIWERDFDMFAMLSIPAFIGGYLAGTVSAAAYSVMNPPKQKYSKWRPLGFVTHVLSRFLPPKSIAPIPGSQENAPE
ncbi:hypothetical protein [Allorhodopirellula heiligendammensis]|uniref:Uncharacterized protein n=1 Tax=Allorhodopirellula heiligendammensis TaxID=2714739 RepID=A0A5C6BVL1_9BACT|nr:hypothetical protein [Allorhodopirellula heiligendammensis]TWU15461.1 hypothetical protein Poly21_26570 [Allorhodopirellula heiligendammensis]